MSGEGERVQRFLTEYRMMVAAVGVLVGFLLHTSFTEPFLQLPPLVRGAHVAALVLAVVSFVALLFPPSLHRFVSETARADEFLQVARRVVGVAFVALAGSLTLSVAVEVTRAFSPALGLVVGALVGALVLAGWFILPRRVARRMEPRGSSRGA